MSQYPIAAPATNNMAAGMPNHAGNTSALRTRPNLRKFCLKTKLCPLHLRGACNRGESCRFAHHESEIQAVPDLTRTKLCTALLKTGCCPKRDVCTFAHSEAELRRVDRVDEDEGRPVQATDASSEVPASSSEVPSSPSEAPPSPLGMPDVPQPGSVPTVIVTPCQPDGSFDDRAADEQRLEGAQSKTESVTIPSSKLLTVPTARQWPSASQTTSALQQRRRLTAQNPLPNLLVQPRPFTHASRAASDAAAKSKQSDTKATAADCAASNLLSGAPALNVEPPSAAKSPHESQQATSYLRFAAVSGAMTLDEMVLYLAKTFGAIFKSRPDVQRRVGVVPEALAQAVAEEAWASAGLSKDSRLTFEEFMRWCSADESVASLLAPRVNVAPCEDNVLVPHINVSHCEDNDAKADHLPPYGCRSLSRRSTEVSCSSPWTSRSFAFPPSPISSCGSPASWQSSPMGSFMESQVGHIDDEDDDEQPCDVTVRNTFIVLVPALSFARRRSW